MQSGLPCISLGPFVRALAQKSYDDFGVFKDQLPGDIVQEKRKKLLQFLPMARHKLIRFLVLVRYLKQNHSRIRALEKIHETINKSEHHYHSACHNFDALYTEMVTTMEPIWDIQTALHILTLGSYRNLPQIIDNSIHTHNTLTNENLSQTFKTDTIHKLNNALRVRLLSDSIPPLLKLLHIENGMVFMIAKNQFKIGISLRMRPKPVNHESETENERIQWSLFELHLLLKASIDAKHECKHGKYIVTDMETNQLLLTVNQKMKASNTPLQVMYKYLSTFCHRLQFAVLTQQIYCIKYIYCDYNVRIERESQKYITVRMWKCAAVLPNNANNIIAMPDSNDSKEEDTERHWFAKETQNMKAAMSKKSKSVMNSSYFNTNTNTYFNLEALDESEKKENEIKSQFRISLSIVYEEQGLDITYHPRFPSFMTETDSDTVESDGIKHLLRINPNNLNLPRLIHNFTVLHCNYRLLYLLNALMEMEKEMIVSKVMAIDGESKAKYCLLNDSFILTQKNKVKIMRNLETKFIEIELVKGKCLEVYVNSNHGQIVIEKSYNEFVSSKPLIFDQNLRVYNESLNNDLSAIGTVVSKLKIDCLLENIITTVQNELNLEVISYAICNKPNKYFVYPSLLQIQTRKTTKRKRKKKGVTIDCNMYANDSSHSFNEFHIIETYTEILNSWNENNSIFIRIPGFGKYCYLVIFFRSQTNIETYCIVNDDFGNILYIHNIILSNSEKKPQIYNKELISEYIQYCVRMLPKYLVRIMICSHTQIPINQLQNTNNITLDIIFPRPATTANLMHIIPKKFEFEVSFTTNESGFSWKCTVKQDTIFANKHKNSFLFALNKVFKFETLSNGNLGLVFEYKNNVIIGQFTKICNYCYKLLIVYNILKGFIDHKQIIKQSSAFYRKEFYKLKQINLISANTIIEIAFSASVMRIEIIWNSIDNVKYYNNDKFNPYINNNDYKIQISFDNHERTIFKVIPNLKLLILHYFNYRQKYHKKLHRLLREQQSYNDNGIDSKSDDFDCYEAIMKFKDSIARHVQNNIKNKKQQSFIFIQYESLSLMMFLQRLYWTVQALNHLNPFMQSINAINLWFYPHSFENFFQIKVLKYDTLRITASAQTDLSQNILAIRILNENKIGLHIMDCNKGWQLILNEINFVNISNELLKSIQKYLLTPQKQQIFRKLFNLKTETNNLMAIINEDNVVFPCLNNSKLHKHVLSLLQYLSDKFGLKTSSNGTTLFSFQNLVTKYMNDAYANSDGSNKHTFENVTFIDAVLRAYYDLYFGIASQNEHLLHNKIRIESLLSVIFLTFINFVNVNQKEAQNKNKKMQIAQIAKSILFIQELFCLYYDEMLQLSLFDGKIKQILCNHKSNAFDKIKTPNEGGHNHMFWYNLYHINDNDIIFGKNVLCVKIHLAQICEKTINKSNTKLEPPKCNNGFHNKNDKNGTELVFEKYELRNNLILKIGTEVTEDSDNHTVCHIFFYQSYESRSNKYRRISIEYLKNLHKLMQSINSDLKKQNGIVGSLLSSFLRQFINRLSEMKQKNEKEFNQIWKQLQKISPTT